VELKMIIGNSSRREEWERGEGVRSEGSSGTLGAAADFDDGGLRRESSL